MRFRALPVLTILFVYGCTANPGGESYWEKACAYALEEVDEPGPNAHRECLESMRGHPQAIADDMARCTLRGPGGASPEVASAAFEACIHRETKEHLARQVAADALLGEIAEELGRRRSTGHLPETLEAHEGAEVVGPWGHPVVYVRKDEESFDLSIVGPDGTHGTADDIRWEPAEFIYFQF